MSLRETYDVWSWGGSPKLEHLNIQLEYPDDTWVECNISGDPSGLRIFWGDTLPRPGEMYDAARELQALGFHL